MVDVRIMEQLSELEEQMSNCLYREELETREDMVKAIKADYSMYEYRYKKINVKLNDEERREMAAYAKENGVELPSIFELVFDEEELEDYYEVEEMLATPVDDDFLKYEAEYNRKKEEEKANAETKTETSKKRFKLFGRS